MEYVDLFIIKDKRKKKKNQSIDDDKRVTEEKKIFGPTKAFLDANRRKLR